MVYRVARSNYLIFGLIFGLMIVSCAIFIVAERGGEAVYALPLVAGAAAFTLAWLARFEVEITPRLIRYRTLLKERQLLRDDIVRVDFDSFYIGTFFGPTTRITIHSRHQSEEPLVIDAGVLTRTAIDAVMALRARE